MALEKRLIFLKIVTSDPSQQFPKLWTHKSQFQILNFFFSNSSIMVTTITFRYLLGFWENAHKIGKYRLGSKATSSKFLDTQKLDLFLLNSQKWLLQHL